MDIAEPEPVPWIRVGPIPEDAVLVETDTGQRVPQRFTVTWGRPTGPLLVRVEVAIRDDDHVAYPALILMQPTDEAVRSHHRFKADDFRIQIDRILKEGVDVAAEGGGIESVARPPRGTRRVLTPELLDEVADVVRDAQARGLSIRRAVAERFRLGSEMTARNWIRAARKPGGPLYRNDQEGQQ